MGRPATKPAKLKDGYYIELRNKGASSGIRIQRDTKEQMEHAMIDYEKTKEVILLGQVINGKFLNEKKKPKAKKSKK
jgi:hypothetical protein